MDKASNIVAHISEGVHWNNSALAEEHGLSYRTGMSSRITKSVGTSGCREGSMVGGGGVVDGADGCSCVMGPGN